jgi:hypothetical protein
LLHTAHIRRLLLVFRCDIWDHYFQVSLSARVMSRAWLEDANYLWCLDCLPRSALRISFFDIVQLVVQYPIAPRRFKLFADGRCCTSGLTPHTSQLEIQVGIKYQGTEILVLELCASRRTSGGIFACGCEGIIVERQKRRLRSRVLKRVEESLFQDLDTSPMYDTVYTM